jgi:bifunctional DNA-binding transcriptional regulator/antitoxin component of YhaV-PrlF toxin-antitoxin module
MNRKNSASDDLSLVRLRGAAQITLPGSIRKALHVREGDYLEASLTKGGVFFKPVVVIDRAALRKSPRKVKRKSGRKTRGKR